MSKFIKGKWKVLDGIISAYNNDDVFLGDVAEVHNFISGYTPYNAEPFSCNFDVETAHANARLITEAPVMYDLLNRGFHILGKDSANNAICREIEECLSRIEDLSV